MVAAFASHQLVGVVGRRGDHHQDLARRGFDGHGSADLALHQLLAELLQAGVDGADDVLSRLGQGVETPLHVGALRGAVGVHLGDLHPLRTAQDLLVGRLHAALTDVVAHAVVVVPVDVSLIHLAHVAQQVAAHLAGILAHGAVDGEEALEIAGVEAQFVLLRDEVRHQTGLAGAHPGVGELAHQPFLAQVQDRAHAHRVESRTIHLAPDHHQVVALLALHQVLAVAVEHLAAGRVLHLVPQRVAFGQPFVFRVQNLQVEQPAADHREDQQDDELQGPHAAEIIQTAHSIEILETKSCEVSQTKQTVTSVLTTKRISTKGSSDHERLSSRKKARWCSATNEKR